GPLPRPRPCPARRSADLGLARIAPMGSAFLVLAAMGSIGLPGTSGFVGEFLVLLGAYRTEPIYALAAATGIILAAVYFLWALQRDRKSTRLNSSHVNISY